MDVGQTLEQAHQAVLNGDRETGRRLLVSLLHTDPRNTTAWLLLSDIVDSDQQREDCLRRVLAFDPGNPTALQKLEGGARPDPVDSTALDRAPATTAARAGILEQPVDWHIRAPLPSGHPADTANAKRFAEQDLRRRGYRFVMLAGALVLTLLMGMVLLVLIVSTVVPQAREKMRPPVEPVLYTATLWCPPCAQAGNPVILWEKAGDGVSRGTSVGELAHGTRISVLAEKWSAAEGRTYYRVSADGQQGWVPESFIH